MEKLRYYLKALWLLFTVSPTNSPRGTRIRINMIDYGFWKGLVKSAKEGI